MKGCPDRPTIERMLDTGSTSADLSWVKEHLDECASCRQRLEQVRLQRQHQAIHGQPWRLPW